MASPDIYIDPLTNDLAIERGRLRLTTNDGEVTRQRINITLNTFRGEWDFNINYGIPWLENANNTVQVLGKTSKNILDYEIKSAILNTEHVRSLVSYTSVVDPYERKATINFSADMEDETTITIENIQASIGGF